MKQTSDTKMSKCRDAFCLGPLAFHGRIAGERVRLSDDCRCAERTGDTFRNGLVFSSRAVKIQERLSVRVEAVVSAKWNGGLRVGFTNVPPSAQTLPLPCMAIPDLAERPGHWVNVVHESLCYAGSVLTFWVSGGGNVYLEHNGLEYKLLSGVDLTRPLWAVIDIYGQTRSISLLGSKRKRGFSTRRSCRTPAPSHEDGLPSNVSILAENADDCSRAGEIPVDQQCVVCLDREAGVTLRCGHRCLCQRCALRIYHQFGTCPLCRVMISDTRTSLTD